MKREIEREWGLRCCFVMHQPDVVLLYLRFDSRPRYSVVSVCVKKCRWVYVLSRWREREREWGLRCCFVMHQPDVVLLSLRFDCIRDIVWWVSVWKSADGYTYCLDEEREREWRLRCCFVMHQPDVVLLSLRFDSYQRYSVVSVCVKKCRWVYVLSRWRERMRITVLFRNASARCCAPLSPIWFEERYSVVSVCVKKCRWVYVLSRWREREREWGLRCCFVMHQPVDPFSPIWFARDPVADRLDEERECLRCCFVMHQPVVLLYLRFSVVSVCVKKCRWVYVLSRWREREREWGLRCCFVMHQPDIVLFYLRFDCISLLFDFIGGETYCGECLCECRWVYYCLDEERENEDYGVAS